MTDRQRFPEPVVKALFALSCNVCAFPGCEEKLTDPSWKRVKARIAHICGEKPGSARHDPSMTQRERVAFDNLLLLCPNHHTLVDELDPDGYPVELLRQYKSSHESRCLGAWGDDATHERYALLLLGFVDEPTADLQAPTGVRLVPAWRPPDRLELSNVGDDAAIGIRASVHGIDAVDLWVATDPPSQLLPGETWLIGRLSNRWHDDDEVDEVFLDLNWRDVRGHRFEDQASVLISRF